MHTGNILILALLVPALTGAAGPAPEKVDDDWLSNVQRQIAEGEYHVTWQDRTVLADLDEAWHAPNRSHNLRTYFTDEGIRVVPRTASESSWEWSLSLIGYGRGETVSTVEEPILSPDENRINYDRGDIVEWYINDRRGLEQGFTLAEPPEVSERDEDERAFLALALGGTLSPVISTDGQAIDFAAPGGAKVLHYAELKVTDATGIELPAWMEGFTEAGVRGIRLVFDDREAVYPVTVDPLATSPAWTAEGDQDGAGFGYSVSTAGDVNGDGYADVIVGASFYDNGETDEGRAFVYRGSPTGLSATADWFAESDQAYAGFGWSVSTAGDVNGNGYADVIIGAYQYDNGETDEGRAFVYHGSDTGLSLTADWTVESNQVEAYFGISVSTAGDVDGDGYSDVIVAAYAYDDTLTDEGRVYVYHGSDTGLPSTPDWTAEGGQAYAYFGIYVSTAGDVDSDGYADVIIGAYGYDAGEVDEGRAYVYSGSPGGLSPVPDWTAESDQANGSFGQFVSAAGDVNGDGYADVIVGAPGYNNGQTDEGRTYVYHGSVTGLSLIADWTAESDQAYAYFGYSASTAGDINGDGYADVIVGAPQYDNTQTNQGQAYVYHGSEAGLSLTADWTAESDQASAYFGISASTAGDVNGDGYTDVIIGAYGYDNGETFEGRAYVYHGSASGLSEVDPWTAESDQMYAYFGWSVSTAGDVNGDGFADVIIGAPEYDNGETDVGQAFVYHGSEIGLAVTADWIAQGELFYSMFGKSVATAGDVNGDGYGDVIVGAPNSMAEGKVFVYYGSSAGLSSTADWTIHSQSGFGYSVSTAGDVNGDGYSDVLIGAYTYDMVFVYLGSPTGLSLDWNSPISSDQDDARFGYSVSTAGDLNGDGYADIIIGAPYSDNGETDEGKAFVFYGSLSGLSAAADWTAESDQAGALFGYSVSTAGDVNGDGYADIIIGAYAYYDDYDGLVFVYHGSATGLSAAADWTAESDQTNTFFGVSVSTAGDLNGDGYADVIIGAPFYDNAAGGAFVYNGSTDGLSTTADWIAEGDQATDMFGWSVSSAGDVNGDGYGDVIVGAWNYVNGQASEGRVFAYYGCDGPGLSLNPRPRRADDSAPIAPAGMSEEPDSFRLALLGRSPYGRGKVKLEYEVKPLGTAFDGTGSAISDTWIDTGVTGTDLNELVSGLTAGTRYHWRMRLLYDPVTTPFQQASRWLTVPWNGWEETDLRPLLETDIVVSQTDSSDPAYFGVEMTYTITLTNSGSYATEVVVRNPLSTDFIFVSATPSQGTCNESAGILLCELGQVPGSAAATVAIVVVPCNVGVAANRAWGYLDGRDYDMGNNFSMEATTVLGPPIGDRVWEDTNGDGIQNGGEPGMAGVLVGLYQEDGTPVNSTFTDLAGNYSFAGFTYGANYYVRFAPPAEYVLTLQDQGDDDLLDSDADPYTWETAVFSLVDLSDPVRWDAGMIPHCAVPDEAVYIYDMTLTDDGNDYPILNFQDPNQPSQVTGYNVYRASRLGPGSDVQLVASDVTDMDESEPNIQWVDSSGDASPTGLWYYFVAAYNHRCPAEGPF